jgi:hypothetical protein
MASAGERWLRKDFTGSGVVAQGAGTRAAEMMRRRGVGDQFRV